MKKVRISLAALTLIVAIAGTTTANATRSKEDAPPCWQADPDGSLCTNATFIECCEDDEHNIWTERAKED